MHPNDDAAAATAAGSGVSCRELCFFSCCCCWAFCCLFSGASPPVGGSEGCLNCMHSSLLATRRAAEVRATAGWQSVAVRHCGSRGNMGSKAWHTRGDCCQNAIELLKYFGYVWHRRRCPCPLNGWLPRFLVAMWKLPPPTMMQHMPMAGHE